jgi:hypothetical protein
MAASRVHHACRGPVAWPCAVHAQQTGRMWRIAPAFRASSKRSSQDELMGRNKHLRSRRRGNHAPYAVGLPPLHAPPDGRGAKSVADLVRMANVLGVKPETLRQQA